MVTVGKIDQKIAEPYELFFFSKMVIINSTKEFDTRFTTRPHKALSLEILKGQVPSKRTFTNVLFCRVVLFSQNKISRFRHLFEHIFFEPEELHTW